MWGTDGSRFGDVGHRACLLPHSSRRSLSGPPREMWGTEPNHFMALTCARTSSAWPSGLTLLKMWAILPSGPMRNVVRSMPMTFLPYMFFSLITPKALQTFLSASASRVKGRSYFSLNFFWASGLSAEMPRTMRPAFWSFVYASRNPHASIVQPGVFALG